jgi:hypothetical protein
MCIGRLEHPEVRRSTCYNSKAAGGYDATVCDATPLPAHTVRADWSWPTLINRTLVNAVNSKGLYESWCAYNPTEFYVAGQAWNPTGVGYPISYNDTDVWGASDCGPHGNSSCYPEYHTYNASLTAP